ncbi:MAG: NHL repeat-containing protein [Armatimonadetes bacterium]|nr:NHL repeat-containing protein [Armatimonadota bacterium]
MFRTFILLLFACLSLVVQIGQESRAASGTWTTLLVPPFEGKASQPTGLAVDAAGNLYLAESGHHRVQKRDPQGNWSTLATQGTNLGQVSGPVGIAIDSKNNLYIAEKSASGARIQKRDALGEWSLVAASGWDVGQARDPRGLTADARDALFTAEWVDRRVQKRTAQGNWVVLTFWDRRSILPP